MRGYEDTADHRSYLHNLNSFLSCVHNYDNQLCLHIFLRSLNMIFIFQLQSAKSCGTSRETLPFVDRLVSILIYIRFSTISVWLSQKMFLRDLRLWLFALRDWISKSVYNAEESIAFMFSRQTLRYLKRREMLSIHRSQFTFWLVSCNVRTHSEVVPYNTYIF